MVSTKIFDNRINRTKMSISTEKKQSSEKNPKSTNVEKRRTFSRRLWELQAQKGEFAQKYPFLHQSRVLTYPTKIRKSAIITISML